MNKKTRDKIRKLRDKMRKLSIPLLTVGWLIFVMLMLQQRLLNPDLTETQLFLNYWKEFIGICIVTIVVCKYIISK